MHRIAVALVLERRKKGRLLLRSSTCLGHLELLLSTIDVAMMTVLVMVVNMMAF